MLLIIFIIIWLINVFLVFMFTIILMHLFYFFNHYNINFRFQFYYLFFLEISIIFPYSYLRIRRFCLFSKVTINHFSTTIYIFNYSSPKLFINFFLIFSYLQKYSFNFQIFCLVYILGFLWKLIFLVLRFYINQIKFIVIFIILFYLIFLLVNIHLS